MPVLLLMPLLSLRKCAGVTGSAIISSRPERHGFLLAMPLLFSQNFNRDGISSGLLSSQLDLEYSLLLLLSRWQSIVVLCAINISVVIALTKENARSAERRSASHPPDPNFFSTCVNASMARCVACTDALGNPPSASSKCSRLSSDASASDLPCMSSVRHDPAAMEATQPRVR